MTLELASQFPPELWPIQAPDDIPSPQLVVYREHLAHNLQHMLAIAGPRATARLRPHCKTHKMPAITRQELALGLTKHKAATLAEAEMLAQAGVKDIFLAYNMVGPNVSRVVKFRQTYPDVHLMVTADDTTQVDSLSRAVQAGGTTLGIVLDLNPNRDRTGIPIGPAAEQLYRHLSAAPAIVPSGFHLYDGHFLQPDLAERVAAVKLELDKALGLRDRLEAAGCPVPRIVCGGTPTFPAFAQFDDPVIELSPGTCVFHDVSYHEKFPDLRGFRPAAVVFTRVVSRPTPDRVTLDCGTKAISSDTPMGQRAYLPAIPDGEQVIHNEEHLVVKTSLASQFRPGDWLVAIPRHVCPTSPMYRTALVINQGQVVDEWPIAGRERKLTV